MSDLLITAGPFKFHARFETGLAPRTCAIFKRLLPLEWPLLPFIAAAMDGAEPL